MKHALPTCHACAQPARKGFEGCCSAECRLAFEHDREQAPDRESVELQQDNMHAAVWLSGRRLNLQNSA